MFKSKSLQINGIHNGVAETGFYNAGYITEENLEKNPNTNGEIVKSDSQPEEVERQEWDNKLEFLMSCISMSVGLGNLWRFPFAAYENGGGAFLIPYLIILALVGRPMYYLEMILGQFSSRANVHLFQKLMPACQGIAYGQLFASCNVSFYYCTVMALTLLYLVKSFYSVLPWSICDPNWEKCVNATSKSHFNDSKSSSELFFKNEVLHEKSNIDDGIGAPDGILSLYLFLAWFIVFLVVMKGVRSSGKIAYFLAIFPYFVMIALLIRGVTLDGAGVGISYFLTPRWDEILKPKVWYEATTQCFFSLNIGAGPVVMYSSYNKFKHNIRRDSIIITLADTFTSLLAGLTIFAILGNLAFLQNTTVDRVIDGGPGIAFISYPSAIANFTVAPQAFSALFFFMLFILGIGSIISQQGCLATVLKDEFGHINETWIAGTTCLIGFLIGLVYVTPGGQFILKLVDYYAVVFVIYIMAIAEVVIVIWIYGLQNLCQDAEFMLGQKIHVYWKITWALVTPILLIAILIYSLIRLEVIKYGAVAYPNHVLAIGWALLVLGIIQIPLWTIVTIFSKRSLGFKNAIKEAFSTQNWGPANRKIREEWTCFKEDQKSKLPEKNSWINSFTNIFRNS